jgi:hypothetical protein
VRPFVIHAAKRSTAMADDRSARSAPGPFRNSSDSASSGEKQGHLDAGALIGHLAERPDSWSLR